MERTTKELVDNAWKAGTVVPAFNVPALPIMAPVIEAIQETNSFALIQVARPEWEKFQAGSMRAIRDEYEKVKDRRYTRLHLDHIPVIDEDGLAVDFEALIAEAIELGYESVMVDGSRLSLDENIAATAKVARMAHQAGIPVEGELGAVLGHEAGPLPPYEELYSSGMGFTDADQSRRFVGETEVDWLSVAIGNIHGAVSGAAKSQKKVAARLNIEHLCRIGEVTGIPLVLHGGSGIQKACLLDAFSHGIAKINIGTTVRQAHDKGNAESPETARRAVYEVVCGLLKDELEVAGSAATINPPS